MDFAHHTVSEFENHIFSIVNMACTCLQGFDSLTWPTGTRGSLERSEAAAWDGVASRWVAEISLVLLQETFIRVRFVGLETSMF